MPGSVARRFSPGLRRSRAARSTPRETGSTASETTVRRAGRARRTVVSLAVEPVSLGVERAARLRRRPGENRLATLPGIGVDHERGAERKLLELHRIAPFPAGDRELHQPRRLRNG